MNVSRETKLDTYVALLQRWGVALNLTSARNNSEAALRALIDDCFCLVPHLPAQFNRLIDLGSGQGFPAIPIAIETGAMIELIEADRRKAAFLTTTLATLGLQGTVHSARIEATTLVPAQCVTARALASVPDLIGMARPFLAPDGVCLFLKGPAAAKELEALEDDSTLLVTLVPTLRPPSTIVKVTALG